MIAKRTLADDGLFQFLRWGKRQARRKRAKATAAATFPRKTDAPSSTTTRADATNLPGADTIGAKVSLNDGGSIDGPCSGESSRESVRAHHEQQTGSCHQPSLLSAVLTASLLR